MLENREKSKGTSSDVHKGGGLGVAWGQYSWSAPRGSAEDHGREQSTLGARPGGPAASGSPYDVD